MYRRGRSDRSHSTSSSRGTEGSRLGRMKIDIVRECPVANTPRVVQVAGMFDVPVAEKSRVELKGALPIEEREWNVGLIVGPSGSGKSTVAHELFGAAMVGGFEWPIDKSILD